jgi:hypothetical protein
MAVLRPLIIPFAVTVVVFAAALTPRHASALTRHDFPEGFVFGAGTSANQVRSAQHMLNPAPSEELNLSTTSGGRRSSRGWKEAQHLGHLHPPRYVQSGPSLATSK